MTSPERTRKKGETGAGEGYTKLVQLRGRSTAHNPPNRFETTEYIPDGEMYDPDAPGPRTQLLTDASRTIIATNDSPDIGFDASINPYRGCEHGCVYCLAPETPILHADLTWRPIGEVRTGEELVAFDEYPGAERTRRLRRATVERVWWSRKPTLRLITESGEVLTTAKHRWLQHRNFRWSRTDQLRPGGQLRRMSVVAEEPEDEDYRAGYLAGLSDGDGTFRFQPGQRSERLGFPAPYWRVALADSEPLVRTAGYLARRGVRVSIRGFDPGPTARRPMMKVETRALASLEVLHPILTSERHTRGYRRGWLAGFFDAEGSNSTSLRMSQVDARTLDRARRYAAALGFNFTLEVRPGRASTLRLVGPVHERVRFLSTVRPAIRRKLDAVLGWQMRLPPERILAIEPGPTMDVVDIQTSTGTFFAGGLATHNCYARPTHEYLGYSAGLDFETKILVKRDAPALLRKALSSPKWQPKVLVMSGVTDPYQPAEAKLRITRGCLEVLAEARNPVGIITKNHRVTRDIDVLRELAAVGAVRVNLSVTSLDPELQRSMEPRTSTPARRLAAIEALTEAGIPVGVMVAPVVPGLTDHEVPAILEAVANAGAVTAGYVALRLPHAVAPLFQQWLERAYPERAARVLARVREMRGGKLYDSRWGVRGRGEGVYADHIATLFKATARRLGLDGGLPPLRTDAFRRPAPPAAPPGPQLGLFDGGG